MTIPRFGVPAVALGLALALSAVLALPALALQEDFDGPVLPADWFSPAWAAGGAASVTGGNLVVDGARAGTGALYDSGRSLTFVATFTGDAWQHIGFGTDYNAAPWIIFSTFTGPVRIDRRLRLERSGPLRHQGGHQHVADLTDHCCGHGVGASPGDVGRGTTAPDGVPWPRKWEQTMELPCSGHPGRLLRSGAQIALKLRGMQRDRRRSGEGGGRVPRSTEHER